MSRFSKRQNEECLQYTKSSILGVFKNPLRDITISVRIVGKSGSLQYSTVCARMIITMPAATIFLLLRLEKGQVSLVQFSLVQFSLVQVKLGQIRFGYVRLLQVGLGYYRVRLGYYRVMLGYYRIDQDRLGQVRLGQVRLGQVKLIYDNQGPDLYAFIGFDDINYINYMC